MRFFQIFGVSGVNLIQKQAEVNQLGYLQQLATMEVVDRILKSGLNFHFTGYNWKRDSCGNKKMSHVLLIDDERKLTDPLRSSFERAGYQITVANDGHTGLSLALVEKPDVIVLDVMMPGLDGWRVCEAIRQHSNVPIIMLTALDDSLDRIKGLELGADDYLVKPFGFKEIEAHIRAMLRRVQLDRGNQMPQQISVGDIVLDLEAHTVTKSGKEIAMR